DREILDLAGLNEGERLEQLIQCPRTTRQDDEGIGIFDQERLANKKIIERDAAIEEFVRPLFLGQPDVAANRASARLPRPAISSFHDAGATAGHDGEPEARDATAHPARKVVVVAVR